MLSLCSGRFCHFRSRWRRISSSLYVLGNNIESARSGCSSYNIWRPTRPAREHSACGVHLLQNLLLAVYFRVRSITHDAAYCILLLPDTTGVIHDYDVPALMNPILLLDPGYTLCSVMKINIHVSCFMGKKAQDSIRKHVPFSSTSTRRGS